MPNIGLLIEALALLRHRKAGEGLVIETRAILQYIPHIYMSSIYCKYGVYTYIYTYNHVYIYIYIYASLYIYM